MSNHSELLHRLREEIRQVETAGRAALYDSQNLSGGIPALDQLLPGGGYSPGSLVEWLAPTAGCGAELLGLLLARSVATGQPGSPAALSTSVSFNSADRVLHREGPLAKAWNRPRAGSAQAAFSARHSHPVREPGVIVIADPRGDFYAPAAVRLGLRPDQLILLQHPREEELYWAMEQALRCPAVAAVYAAADLSSTSRQTFLGSNLDPRWLRRFQLAAEQGGGLGIFVRPARVASRPTWADLQWRVSLAPFTSDSPGSSCHEATVPLDVQLLRCRGQTAGQALALQLNLHTGEVRRRCTTASPLPCRPRQLSAG